MAQRALPRGLAVVILFAVGACNSILGNEEHPLASNAAAGSTASSGASGLSNLGSSGNGSSGAATGGGTDMTDGAGDSAGGAAGTTGGAAGTTGGVAGTTGGVAGTTGGAAGTPSGGAGTAGGVATGGAATGGTGGASHSGGAGGAMNGGSGGTNSSAGTAGAIASAGAGGTGGVAAMSTGCGKAPTIGSDMYNNGTPIPITAASLQRRYILSVPANYSNSKPYRLILAWHQNGGNDKQVYGNKYFHLLPLDTNGTTIFVAPNGQLSGNGCTGTANGEASCSWPNTNDSDVALGDAIVKQIEDNFCIDTNRILGTGWSVGGSQAAATACERPLGASNGYIRAIAVYSGARLTNSCTPSRPVAYYASHGTQDTVLPYSSGLTLAQSFAAANACTWVTPTAVTSGNHVCTDLTGCQSGYPEEFCSFNGDHTADPSDGGLSWEYANAWNFLSQF